MMVAVSLSTLRLRVACVPILFGNQYIDSPDQIFCRISNGILPIEPRLTRGVRRMAKVMLLFRGLAVIDKTLSAADCDVQIGKWSGWREVLSVTMAPALRDGTGAPFTMTLPTLAVSSSNGGRC